MPFATKASCFVRFFCENKKLNLELESVFFLKLLLFDPCTMIWVSNHVITAL
jgi:hypothetical protein